MDDDSETSETKPILAKIKDRKGPRLGRFLPLRTKAEILEKIDNGAKPSELTKEYNIAASTISRFKKYRKSIQKAINRYQNDTNRRSLRGTYHPKMESALHKWYLEQIQSGITITTNMLRVKARELYTKLRENDLDFQASAGWVDKFKRRYGIRLKGYKKRIKLEEEDTDSDSSMNEANGEQEIDQGFIRNIKTEDPFATTFVDVSASNTTSKMEHIIDKSHDIVQCMDSVIQWTVENRIEPLYLTMLRSLKDRIHKKNENNS